MQPTLRRWFALICVFVLSLSSFAQIDPPEISCAGRLDHSFVPDPEIRVPLYVNQRVFLEVMADDGMIVAGGLRGDPGVRKLLANGRRDVSFEPFETAYELGQHGYINAMELQKDGRVIIGGWINSHDVPLIRLEANGSVDQSYVPVFRSPIPQGQAFIQSISLDQNGRLYVGGSFIEVNEVPALALVRLKADGSVDTSFQSHLTEVPGGLPPVRLVLAYPGGGVLVTDGIMLEKFSETGEKEAGFREFEAQSITSLSVDGAGRILVGHLENFTSTRLVRLMPDGRVDESFSIRDFNFRGIGGDGIMAISVQGDGKIVAGGSFSDEEGRTRGLARFHADGKFDPTFVALIRQSEWADDVQSVTGIGFQSSGKVIITGDFDLIDGTERRGVARLYREEGDCGGVIEMAVIEVAVEESEGSARIEIRRTGDLQSRAAVYVDLIPSDLEYAPARPGQDYLVGNSKVTFLPGESTKVFEISIVNDGLIETPEAIRVVLRDLEGGVVTITNTETRLLIMDDDSRELPGTPQAINFGQAVAVFAIDMDSISRAVVGGNFTRIFGEPRTNLVRLGADGQLDRGFNPAGVPFEVRAVHILNGYGPILVGGEGGLIRLHPDGTRDESFNVVIGGAFTRVTEILVQPDEQIVIAGKFQTVNGVTRNGIARLAADGELDESFDPGSGIENVTDWNIEPTGLALQADGRLIMSGSFINLDGFPNYGLVRLETDGTVDRSYSPQLNGAVGAVLLQKDGKLIIGGDFQTINNIQHRGLARLNEQGQLDETFLGDAQLNWQYTVTDLEEGWDGWIYVTGRFWWVGTRGMGDSLFRPGIARFDKDGVVDPLFYTGQGTSDIVLAVGLGLDRSVLVGGTFTYFNGEQHHGLVRLQGDNPIMPGRISFSQNGFSADETAKHAKVTLVRHWGTNGTVSVRFSTFRQLSVPGVDYVEDSETVTFLPGEIVKEVLVPLRDDDEVELWETFGVRLSDGPLGLLPETGVHIKDDEEGFVFQIPEIEVTEGEPVLVHLYHTGILEDSVLVTLEPRNGTATLPQDYEYRKHTALVSANNTLISFTVPTVGDSTPEAAETFTIEVTETSRPVKLGPPAKVTITERAEPGFVTGSARFSGGELTVLARTLPGRMYRVYVSDDLASWSFFDRIYAFNEMLEIRDRPPAGRTSRFYRIQEEPLY